MSKKYIIKGSIGGHKSTLFDEAQNPLYVARFKTIGFPRAKAKITNSEEHVILEAKQEHTLFSVKYQLIENNRPIGYFQNQKKGWSVEYNDGKKLHIELLTSPFKQSLSGSLQVSLDEVILAYIESKNTTWNIELIDHGTCKTLLPILCIAHNEFINSD